MSTPPPPPTWWKGTYGSRGEVVARIGSNAAPDLAQWRQGNVKQQLAVRLTMPEAGRITDLGAWLRGVQGYGSIDVALMVWAWDGSTSDTNAILGRTNTRTISAASFALGSLQKQLWPLQAPVDLDAGAQF